MIITIASFKGGVGKTTTAVHLANYLHESDGPALLVDGDPNKSASGWAKRGGEAFPFKVTDLFGAPRLMAGTKHTVIDTAARPERDELESLMNGCDLLVLPTTPRGLDVDALVQTVGLLKSFDIETPYGVLLTMSPPGRTVTEQVREVLAKQGLHVFEKAVRKYAAHEKAPLAGCLVGDVKGDRNAGNAARDYKEACEEIVALGFDVGNG